MKITRWILVASLLVGLWYPQRGHSTVLDLCGDDAHWNPAIQKCQEYPPHKWGEPVWEINGIPMEKALEIMKNHEAELNAIPGLRWMGLTRYGIEVEVEGEPDLTWVPTNFEGLPIRIKPAKLRQTKGVHTLNRDVTPEHGGVVAGVWLDGAHPLHSISI